jgi:hypothetical protein
MQRPAHTFLLPYSAVSAAETTSCFSGSDLHGKAHSAQASLLKVSCTSVGYWQLGFMFLYPKHEVLGIWGFTGLHRVDPLTVFSRVSHAHTMGAPPVTRVLFQTTFCLYGTITPSLILGIVWQRAMCQLNDLCLSTSHQYIILPLIFFSALTHFLTLNISIFF